MAFQALIQGVVSRILPGTPAPDTQPSALGVRAGRYNELYNLPIASNKVFAADEGSYFVANSGLSSGLIAGIAEAIVVTQAATTPALTIFNSNPSGGKRLYLDYIKLVNTAAGASTTSAFAGGVLDIGNRYSSGGTSLTASIVSTNSDLAIGGSGAVINFGAITATAASAPRQLFVENIRVAAAPCWIVNDTVLFQCGGYDTALAQAVTAATAVRVNVSIPPIVIGPQTTFLLYQWNVANATTPPSFYVEIGYLER